MANELTWHDVLAEEKQQPYFLVKKALGAV